MFVLLLVCCFSLLAVFSCAVSFVVLFVIVRVFLVAPVSLMSLRFCLFEFVCCCLLLCCYFCCFAVVCVCCYCCCVFVVVAVCVCCFVFGGVSVVFLLLFSVVFV